MRPKTARYRSSSTYLRPPQLRVTAASARACRRTAIQICRHLSTHCSLSLWVSRSERQFRLDRQRNPHSQPEKRQPRSGVPLRSGCADARVGSAPNNWPAPSSCPAAGAHASSNAAGSAGGKFGPSLYQCLSERLHSLPEHGLVLFTPGSLGTPAGAEHLHALAVADKAGLTSFKKLVDVSGCRPAPTCTQAGAASPWTCARKSQKAALTPALRCARRLPA
jgi:hypothetical protein